MAGQTRRRLPDLRANVNRTLEEDQLRLGVKNTFIDFPEESESPSFKSCDGRIESNGAENENITDQENDPAADASALSSESEARVLRLEEAVATANALIQRWQGELAASQATNAHQAGQLESALRQRDEALQQLQWHAKALQQSQWQVQACLRQIEQLHSERPKAHMATIAGASQASVPGPMHPQGVGVSMAPPGDSELRRYSAGDDTLPTSSAASSSEQTVARGCQGPRPSAPSSVRKNPFAEEKWTKSDFADLLFTITEEQFKEDRRELLLSRLPDKIKKRGIEGTWKQACYYFGVVAGNKQKGLQMKDLVADVLEGDTRVVFTDHADYPSLSLRRAPARQRQVPQMQQ
ncbi:unnamed protein product [Symbiodinium sp. CCMP2592]|nr:unnamed protein product [Symbiodinium sp. CCMP2592]